MNCCDHPCPACGRPVGGELIALEPLGFMCARCCSELQARAWDRFDVIVALALAPTSSESGDLAGARLARSARVWAPTTDWAITLAVREVRGMLRADVPCVVSEVELVRDSRADRSDTDAGTKKEMST